MRKNENERKRKRKRERERKKKIMYKVTKGSLTKRDRRWKDITCDGKTHTWKREREREREKEKEKEKEKERDQMNIEQS